MTPRLLQRPGGGASLLRGPMRYALRVGERWQRINQDLPHREPPHADWEVYATTPWNFALELGDGQLSEAVRSPSTRSVRPCSPPTRRPSAPPSRAVACPGGVRQAARPRRRRPGPVRNAGPAEALTLIPYGCSNLRIAEFPVL